MENDTLEKKLVTRPYNEYIEKLNMQAIKEGDRQAIVRATERPIPIDIDIQANPRNPLVIIQVGFTTRRIIDAIKSKGKRNDVIIIIEPDLGVFKHVMRTENIVDLLTNENIDLKIGLAPDALLAELYRSYVYQSETSLPRAFKIQNSEIIVDPFRWNTPEEKIEQAKIMEAVKASHKQLELSMGCSEDSFQRWQLMFANAYNMRKGGDISALFDKFEDVPIIVCGGGPSLEDFIAEYRDNQDLKKALIIAADAVLPKLRRAGIRPHIVTRCERKLTTIFQDLKPEDTKGVYYAAYPWTPPEYFDMFEKFFYIFRANGSCLYTKYRNGQINGGVSAGNAAAEIAFRIAKTAIFTGIDLAFIGGKSHTEGTQVEFNIESSKSKWVDVETNSGGKSTTIPVWVRCLHEYEQGIHKWNVVKGKEKVVYNTSGEGARIVGATYKPWLALRPLFATTKAADIDQRLAELFTAGPEEQWKTFKEINLRTVTKLHKCINHLRANMAECKNSISVMESEIDKLNRKSRDTALTPYQFVLAVRGDKANYEKLMKNCADTLDGFKNKYWYNMTFRMMLLDVLQLDLYFYENNINRLHNVLDAPDERMWHYCKITMGFYNSIEFYLEKFIGILENVNKGENSRDKVHLYTNDGYDELYKSSTAKLVLDGADEGESWVSDEKTTASQDPTETAHPST